MITFEYLKNKVSKELAKQVNLLEIEGFKIINFKEDYFKFQVVLRKCNDLKILTCIPHNNNEITVKDINLFDIELINEGLQNDPVKW